MALGSGGAESEVFDLTSGRLTTHKLNLVQRSPDVFTRKKLLAVPSNMVTSGHELRLTGRQRCCPVFMFGTPDPPDQQRSAIGSTAFGCDALGYGQLR